MRSFPDDKLPAIEPITAESLSINITRLPPPQVELALSRREK